MATLLIVPLCACAQFASLDGAATYAPTPVAKQLNTTHIAKLNQVYATYKGTPYRYGGTDRNGFDCSGFINVVYRDAFQRTLPRTTEQIAVAGQPVRRDQLQPGDIVFFKTSIKQLHAGVYTGSGEFIHASTSKGVIKSYLTNTYWQQRYLKARRIL